MKLAAQLKTKEPKPTKGLSEFSIFTICFRR
jgi:hypothetical protein